MKPNGQSFWCFVSAKNVANCQASDLLHLRRFVALLQLLPQPQQIVWFPNIRIKLWFTHRTTAAWKNMVYGPPKGHNSACCWEIISSSWAFFSSPSNARLPWRSGLVAKKSLWFWAGKWLFGSPCFSIGKAWRWSIVVEIFAKALCFNCCFNRSNSSWTRHRLRYLFRQTRALPYTTLLRWPQAQQTLDTWSCFSVPNWQFQKAGRSWLLIQEELQ